MSQRGRRTVRGCNPSPVGALPLDVKRVDADFVGVAGYKWLLGPYSLGFLYVAPRWQRGRPIEHNWIARKDSEDFAGLVNYSHDFKAARVASMSGSAATLR